MITNAPMMRGTIRPSKLTDDLRIVTAFVGRGQYPLYFYDDGFGPLWVYRESLGVRGIIRARTWEDAYGIAEDEIMDDADPDDWTAEERLEAEEHGNLPDGVRFRSSGVPSNPQRHSGYAQEDLNGSALDQLTDEFAADLRITIVAEDEYI